MTFLTPPPAPPPPHLPEKLGGNGFKWGRGVWGGPDHKLIEGCVYWTK